MASTFSVPLRITAIGLESAASVNCEKMSSIKTTIGFEKNLFSFDRNSTVVSSRIY